MGGLLVSCVAENGDRWYQEAYNLVLSVRRFGGGLSSAPFVVNFVDGVDARYEAGLAELDAEVRVVPRFDRRTPASNKLRMLELIDTHQFDVLLALDTDTIVVGDISCYAHTEAVAIKPENRDPYPPQCWRELFAVLAIPEPSRSAVMTSTAQVTYPYYNSGVIAVPRDRCDQLRESWTKRIFDVLDVYESRPDIVPAKERHWTNQLSLALAVAGDDIPVVRLPVAANLSTTVTVHPLFAHEVTPPFVLHYHNEMDAAGFVYRSRNGALNPLIDAFNRERAAHGALDYTELPEPPLARRLLRAVEGRGWYERGPVASVRRHRLLAPLRRRAKRSAQGPTGR
ncbi:MAG TPA: hypothetical protein VNO51_19460 [Ilumatobacteraceae bacterium]|nr:hypothetical protein [Ilumatobacteraceae bacterium]